LPIGLKELVLRNHGTFLATGSPAGFFRQALGPNKQFTAKKTVFCQCSSTLSAKPRRFSKALQGLILFD